MSQTPQIKPDTLAVPASATFPVPTASAANGHTTEEASRVSNAPSLAHLASKYNEEPVWEDFLEAMQEVRRRMNEQDKATE